MEEENKRRLFISGAGHPSGVLRAKKEETEEAARERLQGKGWNMDAPHSYDDEKKEFRVTDKKKRNRKKAPKAESEDTPAEEPKEEAKADEPKEDKPEESTEEVKS